MARYLGRRLAQAAFVVWAAYTLTFVILYLLPSDPVAIMLGGADSEALGVDSAEVDALRAQYGFDQPLLVQYAGMLWDAVRGDFGTSILTGAGVLDRIASELPSTLALGVTALGLALVLGVGVALMASYARARVVRQLLLSLPPLGIAIPSFWLGLLLVQTVSFRWGWLPAAGNDGVASLALPAVTMAIPTAAILAQVLAKSMRTTLAQPYIEIARAKGASRARVQFRHALRNASLPTITLVGMVIGNLVSGAAVAETIFSRSGVGRLTVQAVSNQDIPVVQGVVTLAAVVTVAVALVIDLLYPLVDPRIRITSPQTT